jgi:thiamine-phosphate pyrophosphorylase
MAHKLPRGLYALIDDAVGPHRSVPEKARLAIEGGAQVVQLRLEYTADRQALGWIREVVAFGRAAQVPVLVNDRVDLCLLGQAQGVHLGDDDLPVAVARRLLGPGALIGRTTRGLSDIREALAQGADHVGLGPLFATSTKVVTAAPLGLEQFAAIVRDSPLPVVGIAGITLSTIGEVARAKAWCAAVAADLLTADDLVSRARALQQAFCSA